jgi:hypothetical protein
MARIICDASESSKVRVDIIQDTLDGDAFSDAGAGTWEIKVF